MRTIKQEIKALKIGEDKIFKVDSENNPPQLVEWELTISGYNELSESDKDLARGVIAEAIEVFNDFEGRFSITKDIEKI